MQVDWADRQTEPEERVPRGDDAAQPALLLASFGARPQIVSLEAEVIIGRGQRDAEIADAAVCLIADELLSRRHVRIVRAARGHIVEDLGSRNGTFVDGRRVVQPARLEEGTLLLFGNQVGVYRLLTAAARDALRVQSETSFGSVETTSPALALVLARLRRLAATEAELLLIGETGVGKEVCARAVHVASGRQGNFVAVNCASLPAALVESELFGHAAATRSTARDAKPGLVEAAEGGTLLLDEIGDIPTDLQAKIFRFLQDRTICPMGSTNYRRADVRIIAAITHIAADARLSPVRADLVARLGADPIIIPPLRSRPEDIPGLLARFTAGRTDKVEPAALRALCLYSWPLNVRELQKAVRTAIALADDRELRLEQLPAAVQGALDRGRIITARRSPRAAPERAELENLLRKHGGNVADVARALDRKWGVVWRWLVRLGLSPEKFRKAKPGDGRE